MAHEGTKGNDGNDPPAGPIRLGYESPDDDAIRRAVAAWNRPLPGGPDRALEGKWVLVAVAVAVGLGGCVLAGLLLHLFAEGWVPR